jgi:uncharacterized protein YcbX
VEPVGTVASAWRYPVKSMAGERLAAASVTLQGVEADRSYAFVQAESKSPFPWLTGRELPSLFRYRPAWTSAERPQLNVTTPGGAVLDIASDELCDELTEASGRPLFLLRDHRGSFDIAPLSLMSLATVDGIAEASGTEPEPLRFRMNFYIDAPGVSTFGEESWVGRVLRLGDTARVAITAPDSRCAMITLSPHGGEPLTEVLRSVAQLNDNNAGVYGTVLTAGEVKEGDPVYLEGD